MKIYNSSCDLNTERNRSRTHTTSDRCWPLNPRNDDPKAQMLLQDDEPVLCFAFVRGVRVNSLHFAKV